MIGQSKEQLEAWEERMHKRREEEERQAAEEAERARQEYLKRTGRTEMEP